MLYAIIGMLVIIADQYVKFWTQGHIPLNSPGVEFIPGILSLTNVHNDGAAFGFLSGSGARIPFIILAGVFTLAVIIALATKLISGKLARWSIVLVTAGGLSNCLDRVMYGYVQDMFKTEFINFPVFNVADIFITVFAIVFALAVIFGKTRKDDEDDYEEFEDEEELPKVSRRKAKRNKRRAVEEDYEDEEDEEEEEEEPVPVRKPQKPQKQQKARKKRTVVMEDEEEEEAEEPAPAAPARKPAPQKKAAPAQKAAEPEEDPFAGWDRASAKVSTEKAQAARTARRTAQAAAKPAAEAQVKTATRKAAASAPAAKPAPKPAPKPVVEEEFSLDDILNEFK